MYTGKENAAVENLSRTTAAERFRCEACFKQFGAKSRLVEHMAKAGHSYHEPKCGFCNKHCKCLDALREHLLGPLCKKECAKVFSERGCSCCLDFAETPESAAIHRLTCPRASNDEAALQDPAGLSAATKRVRAPARFGTHFPFLEQDGQPQSSAVALDCEMVGGGEDGSLSLCARICLVDEKETILLHTFVRPDQPITDYRYDITHIDEASLQNAMPFQEARQRVIDILKGSVGSGKEGFSRLLVGHSVQHDLRSLNLSYPSHLIRDTGCYPPMLRTSGVPYKLRDITNLYLGYQIQKDGIHDPYEDAVASMRIYQWIRSRTHVDGLASSDGKRRMATCCKTNQMAQENLSPASLLQHTKKLHYRCWCLDQCPTGRGPGVNSQAPMSPTVSMECNIGFQL